MVMYQWSLFQSVCIIFVFMHDAAGDFLFAFNCPVPQPCMCFSSDSISCSSKGLYQMPLFKVIPGHQDQLSLEFSGNQLTTIPGYAFKNLSSINARSITLNLNSNKIARIDIHAFTGIETVITTLNLAANNLTSLPVALQNLTSLRTLYVDINPLVTLDSAILSSVGDTIQKFSISLNHFAVFPNEIGNLINLKELTLVSIPFPFLPARAFDNFKASLTYFKASLTYFKIDEGVLNAIPQAVCGLRNLQRFIFRSDSGINSTSADMCQYNFSSLLYLDFFGSKLTHFPQMTKYTPSLQELYIRANKISKIENNEVTDIASLIKLDISANDFNSFPTALNVFSGLQELIISENQIASINDSDLVGLYNLRELDLKYNPIIQIEVNSFKSTPLLTKLNLAYTKLTQIPEAVAVAGINIDMTSAVAVLQHLSYLYLYQLRIECSCSNMGFLNTWNVATLSIPNAYCTSGVQVITYIKDSLYQCS